MIRVLLDTDHVSLHERGHLSVRVRLASFSPAEVAVSVVAACGESRPPHCGHSTGTQGRADYPESA